MSLNINQVRMTPGAPNVQISPQLDFFWQGDNRPIGPNATLLLQNQLPDGANLVQGTEWLMPSTPFICGHVEIDGVRGGSLKIAVSLDGVTAWDVIYTFFLFGSNYPNLFGPLEIPGYNMQLQLTNDNPGIQHFNATFIGKGVR